jgi:hypothetical protein
LAVPTDQVGDAAPVAPGGPGGPAVAELWPTLDTSPSPRLYVESKPADGRSSPRLVAVQVSTGKRTDLGHAGAQPRVSPRADAVVFVRADPGSGKRDLYLLRLGDPAADPST